MHPPRLEMFFYFFHFFGLPYTLSVLPVGCARAGFGSGCGLGRVPPRRRVRRAARVKCYFSK